MFVCTLWRLSKIYRTRICKEGENWRVSHSEGILESLITGTITPNQPATLKQCLSKLGGGNSALLTGEAITGSQSIGRSYRPPACLNTVSVWQAGLG